MIKMVIPNYKFYLLCIIYFNGFAIDRSLDLFFMSMDIAFTSGCKIS